MLMNSVLMIVISVFDNSKQRFDSILMMVNSVLKIVNLVLMTVFTKIKVYLEIEKTQVVCCSHPPKYLISIKKENSAVVMSQEYM